MSTTNVPDRSVGAPARSLRQRRDALKGANEIRSHRAVLKRDVKAGRRTLAGTIADPPEWAMNMKVFDLLVATPKIGRVKANRALQAVRISPSKTLGGLTERQRQELPEFLTSQWPSTMPGVRS